MFGTIKNIIQTTTRVLGYIGMMLIFPMMLLTSSDAAMRGIWSKPIPGAFEMSSFILSVFILLGIAYAHQMKDHVRVTILVDRLPLNLSLLLSIFTTLLSMSVIAVLAWQGWVLSLETVNVSDMLRIPQWPFRMLVCLGAVFLFLEFFFDLADYIGRLFE